jgi:hypothetical protein
MTNDAMKKLNEAFSTMLFGGPSDPPDHTYWAGVDIIDAIRLMGVEETPEQKETLDKARLYCESEGKEGSCWDTEGEDEEAEYDDGYDGGYGHDNEDDGEDANEEDADDA